MNLDHHAVDCIDPRLARKESLIMQLGFWGSGDARRIMTLTTEIQ
jgi:hypothetical protein